MTHWNYRVIRHEVQMLGYAVEIDFAIHECYYEDSSDIPISWTEDAVGISGSDIDELRETVEHIKRCMDKPILEIDGDKLKVWKETLT